MELTFIAGLPRAGWLALGSPRGSFLHSHTHTHNIFKWQLFWKPNSKGWYRWAFEAAVHDGDSGQKCAWNVIFVKSAIWWGGDVGPRLLLTACGCGRRRTRWSCRCRTCPRGGAGRRGGRVGHTTENIKKFKLDRRPVKWKNMFNKKGPNVIF